MLTWMKGNDDECEKGFPASPCRHRLIGRTVKPKPQRQMNQWMNMNSRVFNSAQMMLPKAT
ncbi:hypothetical protein V7x_19940 [Crateriforma conspicua]|uniref:Uncharacterized protein n=1 Tax=Crateriforma conspicua TaxID=2527996 RepID=A0A5C6FYK3_9PLAN|nr:hypothetical protein V7x_19940 [Crateriforma conspicua]